MSERRSEEQQNQDNDGFVVVRNRRNYKQDRPSRKDVLDKVASGSLKPEDAERMLRNRRPPRFVVTRTGAIALYNLQKNPIVLYADQWEKLASLIRRDILDKYMAKNKSIIKRRYHPRMNNQDANNNLDREEPNDADECGEECVDECPEECE